MSKNPFKNKCVVKRLDFENCVFGGFKLDGRKKLKRQLRARISKNYDKTPEKEFKEENAGISANESPVLMLKRMRSNLFSPGSKQYSSRERSPVFHCRRKTSNRSQTKINFRSKRKINFERETSEGFTKLVKRSPVLMPKVLDDCSASSKHISQFDERIVKSRRLVRRRPEKIVSSICSSPKESAEEDLNEIEDFTQDTKSLVHISSVESSSPRLEKSDVDCPPNYSTDQTQMNLSRKDGEGIRTGKTDNHNRSILWKTSVRKYGLVNRMKLALSKQQSEKQLWQHRKKKPNLKVRLILLDYWTADGNHILKCRTPISEAETEIQYVFVGARWIPNLKSIAISGSSFWLHPPWVKLNVKLPKSIVFLNVLHLESDEETQKNGKEQLGEPEKFEKEPIDHQKNNHHVNVLYDSLFAVSVSPFLY